MRLLDARKLELVDVRDDDIPRYAILSHTWGDDEVTLQEMRRMESKMPQAFNKQKQTIADKKGYAKIKSAAAMALKRGLAYLWVDTCCIDKTSSSELSEAINSMYLWYKQAAECYAILSDVDPVADNAFAPSPQLRSSRWFTRGWTLQELIAPTIMHFFARDWSHLGQKHMPRPFTELLSDITGIEIEVLDGRVDPAQLSVATRMKWAAHRQTTRLEDTAYCLMGLFQVNMPLLYGEGHRAFARLQEEIIQSTDDQSLFAWSSTARPDKSEDADDPDALCGLLAACPKDFQHAGGMQPLPPLPVYASAPSTMTNLGLRVQLYLRPIHEREGVPMEEDFYAILDSVVRVGETYLCPAITLRRLSVDQFARLRNRPHKFLPPVQSQLASEAEGYRTVYVRQNPVYYNLPQIRVSPLHSMPNPDLSVSRPGLQPALVPVPRFKLVDAFPSGRWNPNTLTMSVKYSRELQVMALFRFQDTTAGYPDIFDVVLGLRRLDAMQWEGWCFQLSHPKALLDLPTPALVVQNTNKKIKGLTVKSKKGVVSSTALRESLGDDPRLMSDATVTGVQLQGRLYVSVSVSLRPETHGHCVPKEISVLLQPDVEEELKKPPRFHTPESNTDDLQDAARILTEPCAAILSTLFEEPDESTGSTTIRLPVRGAPKTSPLDTIKTYLGQQKNGPATAAVRLALAAQAGEIGSMSWLQPSRELINSATEDEYRLPMLHWAMVGGQESTIKYLLGRGADIHKRAKHGLSILHILALFRHGVGKEFFLPEEDLNQELATSRTDGFYKEAPLHLAAAYQGIAAYRGIAAAYPATKPRSTEILRKLAAAGHVAARNALDETPVHRAAALNNHQVIRTLVPLLPHSVDFVDRYGRSPLWHAAATGSGDAVDALIALGASVNLADDWGLGPLHAACREGRPGCVAKLLRGGADLYSAAFQLDLTPLDLAAIFGHYHILDEIVTNYTRLRPINSRLPQDMLNRLLHIASSCGHFECVKLLIAADADPCVSFDYYFGREKTDDHAMVYDVAGKAREVAAHRGHWDLARFLGVQERRNTASQSQTSQQAPLESPPSPNLSTHGVYGPQTPPWGRPNPNAFPPQRQGRPVSDSFNPYRGQPPPPPITSGYSTTLPARASAYPCSSQFPESDPAPDQPQPSMDRLRAVDSRPGVYWHPDHGPAGRYFVELQGEGIDKVARALDNMYRSARHHLPPLVYVGMSGFEKYRRMPTGGFTHNRPEEMAEALRQQTLRIRREEERQEAERAATANQPAEDVMAEASHLHELDNTQVDSLPEPGASAGGDEKLPPPLVYVAAEGHVQYHRWAAGGFGYAPGGTASKQVGKEKRKEAERDRIQLDAHQFRTAAIARKPVHTG